MKKPSPQCMLIGRPIIAMPMTLAGFVTLFAAFQTSNHLVGLFALAMLVGIRKAYEEASAYRAWMREWNGMTPAEPRQPKRVPRWMFAAVPASAFFGLLLLGGASPSEALQGVGLVGIAIGGVVVAGAMIWRLMRRSSRNAKVHTVTVVARPAIPVPTLADAYRALPPYCYALLRGQS